MFRGLHLSFVPHWPYLFTKYKITSPPPAATHDGPDRLQSRVARTREHRAQHGPTITILVDFPSCS